MTSEITIIEEIYFDQLKDIDCYIEKDYARFHWDGDTLFGQYNEKVADTEWFEVEYFELPDQQNIVDGINKKFNINLNLDRY